LTKSTGRPLKEIRLDKHKIAFDTLRLSTRVIVAVTMRARSEAV
jgi:hypothetical protein